MNEYSYSDYDYTFGTSFYRLSQFDYDGQSRLYSPTSVNCALSAIENLLHVTTNRISETVLLESESLMKDSHYNIIIYSAEGKQILYKSLFTDSGAISEQVNMENVSPGVYIVQIDNGSNRITKKIIW